MYNKLEELNRLNDAMDAIVADVNRCNKELESEYERYEEMRLDEFMNTMHELASYAKNLNYCQFRTDIVFRKQRYEYDDWDRVLIFEFKKNGNFNIETNITTHDTCLYSSEFSEYGKIFGCWSYCNSADFEYGWNIGYKKSGKKFIAAHTNEIIDTVRGMIEKQFEEEIKHKANNAHQKQVQLLIDIERVKK